MQEELREKLMSMQDLKYKEFHARLCDTKHEIIGVRLPDLRKIAKEIAKEDWKQYLKTAKEEYYEEVMLQGLVIGYTKASFEELAQAIKVFVPKIDNWAVCDSFCNGLKVTSKYKKEMWEFIQTYLESKQEFEIRFGVVMILSHYIESEYIENVLEILNNIHHEGYYVKMAVAWTISVAFVKFEQKTMRLLEHNQLDDFTYQKSLQKIVESYRVTDSTKETIRSMKRKQ